MSGDERGSGVPPDQFQPADAFAAARAERPSHGGQVVILNGAPRSGKTCIGRAIQARGEGLWLNLGVDAWASVIPPGLAPGIGLRPRGERPDVEAHLPALFAALYAAVSAVARTGANVVVDVGHHDDHSRPLGILPSIPALLVGVRCPVEENLRRRIATGYPADPTMVLRWAAAVHAGMRYDLEIDTSRLTPEEAAGMILDRLQRSQ